MTDGVVGVVLAGGKATRMGGGDKTLLSLGGGTILDRIVSRLAPQVGKIGLNANGDPTRFDPYGLPVFADSLSEYPGPLAGVLAGLDWGAAEGVEAIVTVAGDTPFFPKDLVAHLVAAANGMDTPLVLAAAPDGRHPTFGLWPVALRDDLRAHLQRGQRRVVTWVDKHGGRVAEFPDGTPHPFFNVNTPEDLALAEGWV